MSWDELVNNSLVSQYVSKGAIIGANGGIWGRSPNFNITEPEAASAAQAFNNLDGVRATGLRFEGEKYFILQAADDRVMGKKQSTGCFIYKTVQACVISVYAEGVQPEQCSKVTGAFADYLKSTGY